MNNPLLNLGSNQVDLGGINSPASATANNSPIDVAYIENANTQSSEHLLSSSPKPRIPPTKSILLSVLGSWIPKSGSKTLFWSTATSNPSTGSLLKISSLAVSVYHFCQDTFRIHLS